MTIERATSCEPRFRPDAALARRLSSYSLLAGAALAQAGPAFAGGGGGAFTPPDLPITFAAPPSGNNNPAAINNVVPLDVDSNGTTDFTFTTLYANVFDPVITSSWTTVQVYINPAPNNFVLGHKSKQPGVNYKITSRACNSAVVGPVYTGPGIEGGFDLVNSTNYLIFYRKVRTACSACSNNTYRTLLYDDGKWSDQPGGGAVLFSVGSPVTDYGWINVTIPGLTTEVTLESISLDSRGLVTGIEDNSACLADTAALEPAPDRMLALPLPDGSVPMSLGLLAHGAAGNQLWRAAQARIAELPTTR